MNSNSIVSKNINADLVKVVATLFVVMIHIVATTVLNASVDSAGWYWANLIDSFCRVAPPLFFMVSGAFLLTKIEPISQFFTKRASKILVPALFWSFVYITLRVMFSSYDLTLKNIITDVIMGSGYYHLWFLNAIVVIYFLTPLLRIMIVENKKVEITIVACLFILSWCGGYFEMIPSYLSNMLAYIGYFVVGHLLFDMATKKNTKTLLIAGVFYVLASVFTFYNTMSISYAADAFDEKYYGYSTINIMVASLALFVAIMQIKIETCCKSVIAKISSLGFGIYLAHPLVIRVLGLDKTEMDMFYKQILGGVVVFVISYIVVMIMKKSNTLAKLV